MRTLALLLLASKQAALREAAKHRRRREYEAIQASARKTFGHGLQFQASYSFGKNPTDIAGSAFSGGSGGSATYNNPTNLRDQRSNSDYIRPQRLIISYIYQFPTVNSGRGMEGRALSGWGVSGVTTFQSGSYITFTDANGAGAYGITTSGAQLCPGATVSQIINSGGVESKISNYLNKAVFANDSPSTVNNACCHFPLVPNSGTDNPKATGFGNLGRAIVRGPDQNNWMLSDYEEDDRRRVPGRCEPGIPRRFL